MSAAVPQPPTSASAAPSERPRARLWLIIAGVLSLLSIATLWPLQQVGQVCIDIYPPPPGCGAEEPRWVPLAAIALVIALLTAAVIAYFVVPAPRVLVIAACCAIVAVTALAVGIVLLSQTGIWDPPYPLIID